MKWFLVVSCINSAYFCFVLVNVYACTFIMKQYNLSVTDNVLESVFMSLSSDFKSPTASIMRAS